MENLSNSRLTWFFASDTAISSNTKVRKILGREKSVSSGFVFSRRWATAEMGLNTKVEGEGEE